MVCEAGPSSYSMFQLIYIGLLVLWKFSLMV